MKWFQRKNNIKKRDEHSTYLKVENGRVVPVTGDEEIEKTPEQELNHREYNAEEEQAINSASSRWLRWMWLVVILGLGFATLQMFDGLATENKETFKLQEIKRNTVQSVEPTADKPADKLDVGTSLEDKTTEWREQMKDAFTTDSTTEPGTPEPPATSNGGVEINHKEKTLLFDIRALDEEGTVLLEQVREASVRHIKGDTSKGQYLLRLQAVELKLKRYQQEIQALESQASETPTYNVLLDYVSVKKDSLQSLLVELRMASSESVAPVFNNYVDIHNELTKEADDEFVRKLKELGYEAEIRNGVIAYQ